MCRLGFARYLPYGRWTTAPPGVPLSPPPPKPRMDHYLFGRDVAVADIITAHPSCSKQHAVLQFRVTEKEDEYGLRGSAVRPYLLDLGSVNGSFLNGEILRF